MAYSCGFAIRRQITATSFSTARSGNAERGVTELARAPVNNGRAYPDAEAVLINAKLEGISPVGWGAMGGDAANMHYWEYNSVNLSDGKPVDGEPAQSGIETADGGKGCGDDRKLQQSRIRAGLDSGAVPADSGRSGSRDVERRTIHDDPRQGYRHT